MSGQPGTFLWDGQPIAFAENETIASALDRSRITRFGDGHDACPAKYFCGIGACQACVVSVDGVRMEACLTPAREGQMVAPIRQARP